MKRNYQSELLGVIHQEALALYEVGAITLTQMQEYDANCLASESKTTATAGYNARPPSPAPAYATATK
jgi:DNA-binding transcriptional regulator YiaG